MKQRVQVAAGVASAILIIGMVVRVLVISRGQDVQLPTPGAQVGVRHSRIATDADFLSLGTNSAGTTIGTSNSTGSILIPLGAMWQPFQPNMNQPRSQWDMDAAEWMNARAMNDWQRRFERHLQNPRVIPIPVLYPGPIERMLENVK